MGGGEEERACIGKIMVCVWVGGVGGGEHCRAGHKLAAAQPHTKRTLGCTWPHTSYSHHACRPNPVMPALCRPKPKQPSCL